MEVGQSSLESGKDLLSSFEGKTTQKPLGTSLQLEHVASVENGLQKKRDSSTNKSSATHVQFYRSIRPITLSERTATFKDLPMMVKSLNGTFIFSCSKIAL